MLGWADVRGFCQPVLAACVHIPPAPGATTEKKGAGLRGLTGEALSLPSDSQGLRPRPGLIASEISYFLTASGNRKKQIPIKCRIVSWKKAVALYLELTKSSLSRQRGTCPSACPPSGEKAPGCRAGACGVRLGAPRMCTFSSLGCSEQY